MATEKGKVKGKGKVTPKTMERADKPLTKLQQRFADEYLADPQLNATASYKRAGFSAKTDSVAAVESSKLLRIPKIQAYIAERMKEREKRTEITQDKVLSLWWNIANADPNELIQYRRVCCRHCYGKNHEYQWLDVEEYTREVELCKGEEGEDDVKSIPSDAGGYGFRVNLPPHALCPKCVGEGVGEVFAADTRALKGGARLLYDGVKQTREGFEIKMLDRSKALESVARHLGMFNDKLLHGSDPENPLQLLMAELSGTKFKVKG